MVNYDNLSLKRAFSLKICLFESLSQTLNKLIASPLTMDKVWNKITTQNDFIEPKN